MNLFSLIPSGSPLTALIGTPLRVAYFFPGADELNGLSPSLRAGYGLSFLKWDFAGLSPSSLAGSLFSAIDLLETIRLKIRIIIKL